jgi:hypothetical protein
MSNIREENPLRRLARSQRWQTLYHRAKEIGSIHLFHNQEDFSKLQVTFLSLLEEYASANFDLLIGEDLISEEVIKDWIRLQSYFLYKSKHRKKLKLDKNVNKNQAIDRVVFRRRNKNREVNKYGK